MIKRGEKIIASLIIGCVLLSTMPYTQAFATSEDRLQIKVVNIDGKLNTQYTINGEILRNQWYEYDVQLASIDNGGKETQLNEHRKVYLDGNGCPLHGLQEIDGDTYYLSATKPATGVVMVKGATGKYEKYVFGNDGKRITDPTKVKYTDKEYTVSEDGSSVTMTVDGVVYNVPKDESLAGEGIVEKDGRHYQVYRDFDTLVAHINKSKKTGDYYAKEDGTLASNEWIKDEGNVWYYYGADFKSVKGYQTINGNKYYFSKYGTLFIGWKAKALVEGTKTNYKDKTLYYFGEDGAIKEGWINYNGKWYYIYSDGLMATDTTIDGYYVNKNGVWV
ncbi:MULTISPECIES: putative cell wall binding protein [unclassified Clostridium]|uniref:putative cell wall binding protein n=1 Tax=unclassified Clostridium TaxID=2614128 RepID=UPI000297A425|nr:MULTISPECIES: putative cell wall binding protein [unclassified Clostridium]EKQ51794.1 MAG: putative cell wall binding protein [Clostridium sp. Maddingley MBC34-26]